MNILIINQPTGNRGDESAHKGLVRKLSVEFPKDNIIVCFFGEEKERVEALKTSLPNVKYLQITKKHLLQKIPRFAIKNKLTTFLVRLYYVYRMMDNQINEADYVICAPGGICMGPFMNWNHIFWLKRALAKNKPTAYYSRSFGPFTEDTEDKKIFKKESVGILNKLHFLSIRDKKTMEIASGLGIKYKESIDTAFLDEFTDSIPYEVSTKIGEKFVIFVPNALVWHKQFKARNATQIEIFYKKILMMLKERLPDYKIVMMPQLNNQHSTNDYLYFDKLRNTISVKDSIYILPDTYNSDVQQAIISKAYFVLGARYHSIIFSVRNECRFVSLSYEHKMFGMLDILGLSDFQVDIRDIGTDSFNCEDTLRLVRSKIEMALTISNSARVDVHAKAKKIATNCFEDLKKKIEEKRPIFDP